jgi:glucoamylase
MILFTRAMGLTSMEYLLAQTKVSKLTMLLSYLGLFSTLVNQSPVDVDSYVSTEWPIAKAGLLANIGPNGAKSSGAHAGVVIASPNTEDPNYLYAWIRDSSLVFKNIIDQYTTSQDASLRTLIDQFVNSEAKIQLLTNPSGSITTGGLGEPKFNIDETAFTGPWGRPQRGA